MLTNNQNEFNLPAGDSSDRNTARFLPRYFRTEANRKFLQATLDQLVKPGVAEPLNGYMGRKNSKAFKSTDNYISDVSADRENYQFETSTVIKDELDNVVFYKDYIDYINQITSFGGFSENHDKLNSQESYAWNPNIDWDKFTNFREYYWMPNGPTEVPVRGQSQQVVSTYTVSTVEDSDNVAYVFNNGDTRNPTLELYRGQTYRFEIDTPGHPFAITLNRSFMPGSAIIVTGTEGVRSDGLFDAQLYGVAYDAGDFVILPDGGSVKFEDDENVSTIFNDGIRKLGEQGEEIANIYIEQGVLEFTIPENAPDVLFYLSNTNIDTGGEIRIADIEENSFLDISNEILGKKTYLSANGVEFTNGLKIYFQGQVTPQEYQNGYYYVEGVGKQIKLISEKDLEISGLYSTPILVPFDDSGFDNLPFGNASNYPIEKEYMVINRASPDLNPWTRYNRWFHRDVLEKSFEYNGLPVEVDETARAKRPIIEFDAGLKLFNYGTQAKKSVDLVDTFTTDVFSTIEGSFGYNVDGVDLFQGMRVLFTADTDILVKGKIYEVNFVLLNDQRQITLVEVEDTEPLLNESVLVKSGNEHAGMIYHYDGSQWKKSQLKTQENQAPLFDLCCPQGNFYGDLSVFDSSTFRGTKLFSYKLGSGTNDPELGFPLSYKNINNSGDILFEFNLLKDSFTVQTTNDETITVKTKTGNLRKYSDRENFQWVNSWNSKPTVTRQKVLRQYTASNSQLDEFQIDVYDNAGDLNDLIVNVYVNQKLLKKDVDYDILRIDRKAFVRMNNILTVGDVVLIKTQSSQAKNSNGWYEFPINYEKNPLNQDPQEFTLGEVIDHVNSMIEDIVDFSGDFPGKSNIRDLGPINRYGKRFVKHSGPVNLALYHITSEEHNILKALEYSKREYSKFKRNFLETSANLFFGGNIKQHTDAVITELNREKIKSQSFYFSEMLAYGDAIRTEHRVLNSDNQFYAITENFDLQSLSSRSVTVYLNGVQLLAHRDYDFNDQGFVVINIQTKLNDIIEIFEYDSTDGSFVPPTPTKLGLYPKYHPEIIFDDTYQSQKSTGPYKIQATATSGTYANQYGWFYPLYLDRSQAEKSHIGDEILELRFSGYSETFYIPNEGGNFVANDNLNYLNFDKTVDGPFKIYGESADGKSIGWFYPVYRLKSEANNHDSQGTSELLKIKGLIQTLYIPENSRTFAGQDNTEFSEYPNGVSMIQGHDGSLVKAFKDYRDLLLLEFEKRIFNNIKIDYKPDLMDINDYIPGKFRNTGFDKSQFNQTILNDFVNWLQLVDNDYTENYFYDRNNQFTFNYSSMNSVVDQESLPGFWRGVYKQTFDTDRPHSHPWEMLGYTIKPEWWDSVYGPAPYTSNNLILWDDLERGLIREPGKPVAINKKYVRPGLKNFIPADNQGKLKSPLESNYAKNFFYRNTSKNFVFGDHAPVENAWRKSSEYPFAVIRSYLLNQPCKVMNTGFDLSRITRNLAGQLVYSNTLDHITLDNLVFPNSDKDPQRVFTSGLVNYLYNYLASNVYSVYDEYRNNIKNIKNQLSLRIAGFTDKSKFKLILDSKSPSSELQNGVFVPDENYQVFLNKSSPIELVNYSGVIVEKASNGYVVRGYDNTTPVFNYYQYVQVSRDIPVTIGGISETTTIWAPNKQFIKDQILENNSSYYRVLETFTSNSVFSEDKLKKLDQLPIVGGKTAIFRRNFDKRKIQKLPYGTRLNTFQEVVDFILGYGEYLKDQGFVFDYFNNETEYVENWDHAAREFLFWTTQGWTQGTTISLSPSASRLQFSRDFIVVDNVFDDFYDYSILQSDGKPLEKRFNSILRSENQFGLEVKNNDNGIYNIDLPLVQKEHVILLDNVTIFDDIVYQPTTGYRQERIKVTGYRSDNWNGGLNIPGFVYDDAKITEWESWKDYQNGDLVKYKQYFYVAKNPIKGSEEFDTTQWYRLNQKPESQLLANFDYKINQFADFYDLDSDNFDSDQQKLAQHLIGYQKREYLSNIINNDISQFKFYQGFIQDKGTKNAIQKLFSPLGSVTNDLEIYEEWALQVGRYGNINNSQRIELVLDQEKFIDSPQAIELVNQLDPSNTDTTFFITPDMVYSKPTEYNHKPFPTTTEKSYVLESGYVHEDDVTYKAGSMDDLMITDVNLINFGDYIWVTNTTSDSWTVLQAYSPNFKAVSVTDSGEIDENSNKIIQVVFDKWISDDLSEDQYIGLKGAQNLGLTGFYKIKTVNSNNVGIAVPQDTVIVGVDDAQLVILDLREVRIDTIDEINQVMQNNLYQGQKVWVDNDGTGKWSVLENKKVYSQRIDVVNPAEYDSTEQGFSQSINTTQDNLNLFVGSPGNNGGVAYVYKRGREINDFVLSSEIRLGDEPSKEFYDTLNSDFGKSLAVSNDAKYLAISAPNASNIKSRYRGDYRLDVPYEKFDVVKYENKLWRANKRIEAVSSAFDYQNFNNFENIVDNAVSDSTAISLLISGDVGVENTATDHYLVRVPRDQYLAIPQGSTVQLDWNDYYYQNGEIIENPPFSGLNTGFTSDFIKGEQVIDTRIDIVFVINSYFVIPEVGTVVQSQNGEATVTHVNTDSANLVIYANQLSGEFDATGVLNTENSEFVGNYQQYGSETLDTNLGGFWKINISGTYDNRGEYFDYGSGLVFQGEIQDTSYYYTISDNIAEFGSNEVNNRKISYIENLSYYTAIGPDDQTDFSRNSNIWTIQTMKNTLSTSIGDKVSVGVYNDSQDISDSGIKYSILQQQDKTISDIWDGYIEFTLTPDSESGTIFEPEIGDIIYDAQKLNGSAITLEKTFEAQVRDVQRKNNRVKIYLKVTSGELTIAQNIGELNLIRKSDSSKVSEDSSYGVDRLMGEVVNQFDIKLPDDNFGPFLVFEEAQTLEIPVNQVVDTLDYYFYEAKTRIDLNNLNNDFSIPSSDNRDYLEVKHIIGDVYASSSGMNNQGAVALYYRDGFGNYEFDRLLLSERSFENSGYQFGKKVKFSKNAQQYYLITLSNGAIEIFNHGIPESQKFLGKWNLNANYSAGDIVEYQGNYYRALLDIFSQTDETISNVSQWENISWEYYRDHVLLGSEIEDFDANQDGSVIIVKIKDNNSENSKLAVYRRTSNGYGDPEILIEPPTDSKRFAESIAINPQGNKIAIGDPYRDGIQKMQGKVYVYSYNNSSWELLTTLQSPKNEESERFGSELEFTETSLIISSVNGDVVQNTTFDQYSQPLQNSEIQYQTPYVNDAMSELNAELTTFDRGFTQFKNVKKDNGLIYVYDDLEDQIVFAETIDYVDFSKDYGDIIYAKDNHIYVGLVDVIENNREGKLLEFSRPKDQTSWTKIRNLIAPVDLERIKSVFLYNKRENQIITYLDYIDPVQGKIAGVAEQELTHKMGYDPATYNVGTSDDIDQNSYWGEEHVGELWWNTRATQFTYAYQGDTQYQKDNWNELQPESSVRVFEWVSSYLTPVQWDELSDTDQGLAQGISGTSLYGNDQYSQDFQYDAISQRFIARYFFWVELKTTVPENTKQNRTISALNVARLIANPRLQGYRFVNFLAEDRLVINNCNSLLKNQDIVLCVNYSKNNTPITIHNQYQILTDGLESSRPQQRIERKWFDSLIGYDQQLNTVPDNSLSVPQRYGVQDFPRQSMFVNRIEALKQVIERVNLVLNSKAIVDEFDISRLFEKDEIPVINSGLYDNQVDTFSELRFISTNKVQPALIQPVIENGEIIDMTILDPGRGYKVSPAIKIQGTGSDAEAVAVLNNLGQIVDIQIINSGNGYDSNATASVRKFSALVIADETVNDSWSLYEWNIRTQSWERIYVQSYDVSRFWEYQDWYDQGVDAFTSPDFTIDYFYQLPELSDRIGDIIKVRNAGSGGWLLIEKTANVVTEDITVNYKTVARENGTIQFSKSLYEFSQNTIGYDNKSYDSSFYDINPINELRIILETIRDHLFVDDLSSEYNQLFLASLRYILSEQNSVDWFFKTSFIKVKNNLGSLQQKTNFTNNNLESYEQYVNEVKPYKTTIREYLDNYNNTDTAENQVTDFDLPPYYSDITGKIQISSATITDNTLLGTDDNVLSYPRKSWADNIGRTLDRIEIGDPGSGYNYRPVVKILGGGGQGATAEAYVGYGKITKIIVTNPGRGYTSSPEVVIEGSQSSDGTPARATAVLRGGVVRSPSIKIKFDRVSKEREVYIQTLDAMDQFSGNNVTSNFNLTWPMDMRPDSVTVKVNGKDLFRSEYSYQNITYNPEVSVAEKIFDYGDGAQAAGPGNQKIVDDFTYHKGRVTIHTPPSDQDTIEIHYKKSIDMLDANDRIKYFYQPETGMLGNDVAQLIDGIDYGGVEITGIDFGSEFGWTVGGWDSDLWDNYSESYEDIVFVFDGSTVFVDLDKPLENNVVYNFYIRRYDEQTQQLGQAIRIDDENYGTTQQSNPQAIMSSVVGDGVTQVIDINSIGLDVADGDQLIIRKITSDGSVAINDYVYDTELSGGSFEINSAKGILSEDIVVDGDDFVTAETSHGPQELISGQVMDSVNIKVYDNTLGDVFAYSIFKDILNRTHYKRLDQAETTLAEPLNYNDLNITVVDASNLSEPNVDRGIPGIIFINGERIEYYLKQGNVLKKIRRGTLGTGIKQVHDSGSQVYDYGIAKNIPYNDITRTYIMDNATVDGVNRVFTMDFVINRVDEIEVFVAGKRLNKSPSMKFQPALGLKSPEADQPVESEFSVATLDFDDTMIPASPEIGDQYVQNNKTFEWDGLFWKPKSIEILTPPQLNSRVVVVKKIGETWTDDGDIALSNNEISLFLKRSIQ